MTSGRTLRTTRFGEVTVDESRVYTFVDGLLGFPGVLQYALIEPAPGGPLPPGGPCLWLQAVEPGSLAFVVCDPRPFFPDYRVGVRPADLEPIRMGDVGEGRVLVILTIRKEPEPVTANLLGPLVLNPRERLARQLVLSDSGYTTRHPLVPPAPAGPESGRPASRVQDRERPDRAGGDGGTDDGGQRLT